MGLCLLFLPVVPLLGGEGPPAVVPVLDRRQHPLEQVPVPIGDTSVVVTVITGKYSISVSQSVSQSVCLSETTHHSVLAGVFIISGWA